jgi:hypothetical protein
MKIWSKIPMFLGVTGWMLANAWAGPAPPEGANAAIQAIQQAADPSAVVAAYANGTATDPNDPKLFEAYVNRMVDLGLPELAYHQAQTLTTLQSNNGLAWGVVAYVNARRGDMPGAISAINLAAPTAPNNALVQRTAGEIVAWYDLKADKAQLPENAKDGLTKVRTLLEKQPAYTAAYSAAKEAYQTQANAAPAPAQAAPSQAPSQYGYAPQAQPSADQTTAPPYATAPPPPPDYSPAYYYDSGPTWVEPAPWWWWQPVGFFAGFDFFPFSTFVVFDRDDFFFQHHHFFDHDRFFHDHDFFHNHGRSFHHDGLNVAFHDSNHAFVHRDGQRAFFGTAARPDNSVALSAHANFVASARLTSSSASARNGASSLAFSRSLSGSAFSTTRGNPMIARSLPLRSGIMPHHSVGMRPPPMRFGGGMPRSCMAMSGFRGGMPGPAFRGPAFSAPRTPMGRGSAAGGFHSGMAFHGGGFHGGGGGHR